MMQDVDAAEAARDSAGPQEQNGQVAAHVVMTLKW